MEHVVPRASTKNMQVIILEVSPVLCIGSLIGPAAGRNLAIAWQAQMHRGPGVKLRLPIRDMVNMCWNINRHVGLYNSSPMFRARALV